MKPRIFLLSLILVFGLYSCKQQNNTEDNSITPEFIEEHTAQNSLDWSGDYQGVLPCADCEGIKVTITLNSDNTFSAQHQYLEEDTDSTFQTQGTFEWDNTGFIVTLKDDKAFLSSYKVVEGALIQLDEDKNEITGELAEYYRLAKAR